MFMEIVDDSNIKEHIRQAAAIQLKLTVESKWKVPKQSKTQPMSDGEKSTIRQFLLTAFLRSHKNTKILPIYRVIVCTVVEHDYKDWQPANDALLQM